MSDLKQMPDGYWKDKLSSEQYNVCRLGETESPFSGKYYNNHETGMYECVACGHPLFSSETKFDSGTGWPSFWDPVGKKNVEFREDTGHGLRRTEVICSSCGAHLGHIFPDGPRDKTGMRYCINSIALNFKPAK